MRKADSESEREDKGDSADKFNANASEKEDHDDAGCSKRTRARVPGGWPTSLEGFTGRREKTVLAVSLSSSSGRHTGAGFGAWTEG